MDDLWVLPLQCDRKPVPLLVTDFNERSAKFSPDMRWIAYASDESGRYEVYVRPFLVSGADLSTHIQTGRALTAGLAVVRDKKEVSVNVLLDGGGVRAFVQ